MVEFSLQEPCLPGGGAVVQHQVGARGMQAAANRGADALGPAGDQYGLTLHATLRFLARTPYPLDFGAI